MASAPAAPSSLDLARRRVDSRRSRETLRLWGLRLSALAGLTIAATAATFVGDFLFDLGRLPRVLCWLGIGLLIARLGYRRWWPIAISRRHAVDWAVLVEHEQPAQTSLVAAMQFSDPEQDEAASPQLKRAVIERAEHAAAAIDPLRGFRWSPLPARAAVLLLLALMISGFVVVFPAHASVFGWRMLLREAAYPTRTRLVALEVNGRDVPLEGSPRVRIAEGVAVRFKVQVAGEMPPHGAVILTGEDVEPTRVELSRDGSSPVSYQGRLESLEGPRTATIQLGDALTPKIILVPIPRPVLTTSLTVTPPAYARHNAPPQPAPGARTAAVLPGTMINLTIQSEQKPLREVAIELSDPETSSTSAREPVRFPLQASENRRRWRLDPAGTPLAAVDRPAAYRVFATDDDGLSPAIPVRGLIELREDHPPRVAADVLVTLVLPTARPRVAFSADDDFGVETMAARIRVRREGAVVSETVRPRLEVERTAPGSVSGSWEFELSGVDPQPGDTIEIIVEATDERGPRPGESAHAEPILLEVTDRAGLFARLREADETTAERLDAMIQQELGIGDQP